MTQITITEALQEGKTLDKRLAKKHEFYLGYIARQAVLVDPMLKEEGGSVGALARERQAIHDLEERKLMLAHKIKEANMAHSITVGRMNMTIQEWLIWRRDIAPGRQLFLTQMRQRIDQFRKELDLRARQGQAINDQVVVNIDERDLATEIEDLETTLGTLDGQLSLKNATILIDV
jgi:hypothetical protein